MTDVTALDPAPPPAEPVLTPSARDSAAAPGRPQPPGPARLVSLDAYRGFVMLLMASDGLGFAAYARDTHAGGVWPVLVHHTNHVEWRGCTLWDLIQPSFTFIVGVAMPFSLARRRSQGQAFGRLFSHALVRSFILIALGIFLRSIGRRQTNFTFEDTLTQIGLGYPFAFLLSWARPRWQAAAAAFLLVGYWLAFALYPLPPAGFDPGAAGLGAGVVATGRAAPGPPGPAGGTPDDKAHREARWYAAHGLHGFAAHWDKNTNLAADFDRWFLNLFPRPARFTANEGGYQTLSFIPTLATMLLGLLAGHLMRGAEPPQRKALFLALAGLAGLAVGGLLDVTRVCPSVKRIWTPSWVIFSGGWACLLLAGFYAVIDWGGRRRWAFPLLVAGMNSIAMYCLADGGFRDFARSSLRTHVGPLLRDRFYVPGVGQLALSPAARAFAPIAEMAGALLALWLVCLWMYRRKIFLRI